MPLRSIRESATPLCMNYTNANLPFVAYIRCEYHKVQRARKATWSIHGSGQLIKRTASVHTLEKIERIAQGL